MAYFIQQFGSEEKLEAFYGKRTNVIKDELRNEVEDQMLAERMAARVTGDTKVSPAEIKEFYNSMPEDSLNRFVDWCNMGPRLAEVTEVQAEEIKPEGFKTFEMRK